MALPWAVVRVPFFLARVLSSSPSRPPASSSAISRFCFSFVFLVLIPSVSFPRCDLPQPPPALSPTPCHGCCSLDCLETGFRLLLLSRWCPDPGSKLRAGFTASEQLGSLVGCPPSEPVATLQSTHSVVKRRAPLRRGVGHARHGVLGSVRRSGPAVQSCAVLSDLQRLGLLCPLMTGPRLTPSSPVSNCATECGSRWPHVTTKHWTPGQCLTWKS